MFTEKESSISTSGVCGQGNYATMGNQWYVCDIIGERANKMNT
ncbi:MULTISPECIES: hypothetical protein [Sphingobacterium]|nr:MULTISPECIES: hypothetical protein [Sphingobacterium]